MLSFFIRRAFPALLFLTFSISKLDAQTVYKTPSGAKYHTATCRTVKNVSEAITLEKAIESGLDPCKVCQPVVPNGGGSKTKQPGGEAETVQCKGKTKAGTRCKHMTKIANGYCFQHQPG